MKEVILLENIREVALWVACQTGISVGISSSGFRLFLNTEGLVPEDQDYAEEIEALAEGLIHGLRKRFDVDADYQIECGRLTLELLTY